MLSEENKVPENSLWLDRWQGLPSINKVNSITYETVLSFKVKFVHSPYSVMKTNWVCLGIKKNSQ